MSNNRDQAYVSHLEDRVRTSTTDVAAHLRDLADRIDRIATYERVDSIPGDLVHALAWGMANAHVDTTVNAYADLQRAIAEIGRD